MSITDWPVDERPREKFLKQGAKTLSDAELLAIFLRTGVKNKTAVDLARDLIHTFKGLRGIFEADVRLFCMQHGLGLAKYVQLQACLEMAKRHLYTCLQKPRRMDDLQDIAGFLISQLRHQQREIFAALFLDNQLCLIAYEELFMGSLKEIAVHPRELVRRALSHNAANIIVAHNHPSGDVSPSYEDKQVTNHLRAALALIDVKLADHMIIGEGKVFSFAEKGLLS
jgi:DNA repair protein RadC